MILVIADDFSGAAEIAGVAHQFGLTAEVQTDRLYPSGADVCVVDANSRSLNADLAAEAMQRLADSIKRANPLWLYKKVDSVLRGPILAELNSLCDSLGFSSSLLINANPRKGRIVRAGELIVDSRPIHLTDFANDPEHPRTSPSIVMLLDAETDQLKIIDNAAQINVPDRIAGIYVANVESSDALEQYAEMRKRPCLLAGGAEFFESILSSELGNVTMRTDAALELQPHTLIVRGTSVRRSGDDSLREALEETDCSGRDVDASVAHVCRQLSEKTYAMIAAGSDHDKTKTSASDFGPEQLHQRLMEVVIRVRGQQELKHVWVEGGRTASGLVRACGWKQLRIDNVYADGVVGLQATQPGAPALVVKPGSYRWPVSNARYSFAARKTSGDSEP